MTSIARFGRDYMGLDDAGEVLTFIVVSMIDVALCVAFRVTESMWFFWPAFFVSLMFILFSEWRFGDADYSNRKVETVWFFIGLLSLALLVVLVALK